MVFRHCLESLAEERYVLIAPDEAHVRDWMNEGARVLDRALLDDVRPKLPRQVELDIDLQRFGYIDAAVGALGRVIQLTIGGVAGAGVVPGVRAFEGGALERFEHRDLERRLQFF